MKLLVERAHIMGKWLMVGGLVLIMSGCATSFEECEPGVEDIGRVDTALPHCP